jgi:putative redox protein
MAEAPKPQLQVQLVWEHDLVLSGSSGQTGMTLDSNGVAGPSPMQALAFGVAACMAMDVVHILKKGRHELHGLRVDLSASRSDENPKRFTGLVLHFTVNGDIPADAVERSIELSRDKYCSAWHSIRQDISLNTTYSVSAGS